MEALNFCTFVGLSFFCHWFGEWYHHHHLDTHPQLKQAVQRYMPVLVLLVSQPHFWHGVKDYLIHLFIYSGLVLPTH